LSDLNKYAGTDCEKANVFLVPAVTMMLHNVLSCWCNRRL